jgi:hypothetical protein
VELVVYIILAVHVEVLLALPTTMLEDHPLWSIYIYIYNAHVVIM